MKREQIYDIVQIPSNTTETEKFRLEYLNFGAERKTLLFYQRLDKLTVAENERLNQLDCYLEDNYQKFRDAVRANITT